MILNLSFQGKGPSQQLAIGVLARRPCVALLLGPGAPLQLKSINALTVSLESINAFTVSLANMIVWNKNTLLAVKTHNSHDNGTTLDTVTMQPTHCVTAGSLLNEVSLGQLKDQEEECDQKRVNFILCTFILLETCLRLLQFWANKKLLNNWSIDQVFRKYFLHIYIYLA